MTEISLFNLDHFLSLSGSELSDYAEPFVNIKNGSVPVSVYRPLQARLADLDERHLVYALEICMLLNPQDFVSRVVDFLSHPNASVCCVACNLVRNVSETLVTEELAKKIAATPVVDLFAADVRSGMRIQIGTNEEFVCELTEKFANMDHDP